MERTWSGSSKVRSYRAPISTLFHHLRVVVVVGSEGEENETT